MIVFPCHVCQTLLSANDPHAGQLVRCPTCATVLRVPLQNAAAMAQSAGQMAEGAGGAHPSTAAFAQGGFAGAGGGAAIVPPPSGSFNRMASGGFRSSGKRYGFNCGYCSSRLEAIESMAAQEGQCPTCGNNITIPILDRYGRLIDPKTRQIIKQDPHPVHAYAAAGERAPKILRRSDGQQNIQCPRCGAVSPITSNNCRNCGMPFTMEGTTLEAASSSNGWCVASLVLGIIGIFGMVLVVPSMFAIAFGVIGLNQVNKSGTGGGGKGMAVAGMICGGIGFLGGAYYYFH